MAYQTGTATSRNDLLDKLRVWLSGTLSWTINGWADLGSDKRLHVQKGNIYVNFRSVTNSFPFDYYNSSYRMDGIAIQGSTGYDSGEDWDHQPGYVQNTDSGDGDYQKSAGAAIVGLSGSFSYWFFATGDLITVVVESASGVYQHMIFGQITKFGTYTGGYFCSASFSPYRGNERYNAKSACDFLGSDETYGEHTMHLYLSGIDSKTDWWCNGEKADQNADAFNLHLKSSAVTTTSELNEHDNHVLNMRLFENSPNSFNGVHPLLYIYLLAQRSSSNYSILGYLDGVRQINMLNKLPGDEITLGSDTWKIFPWFIQEENLLYLGQQVGNVGMAYKK